MAPSHDRLEQAATGQPQANFDRSERRARNMRVFAADLAKTGMLRPGLSVEEAADIA